jgi:hypothetical protein
MSWMSTADVAIVGCRRLSTADPTDLYPDPDAAPLRQALHRLGATARAVSWDDPDIDWVSFPRVVVSSTWDGVDRPVEYRAWVRVVSEVSVLMNPARVIEWNLDKQHQKGLADAGVPMVPTVWVEPHDSWDPPSVQFVVKPSISSGGRMTARYASTDAGQAIAHLRTLQEAGQTVMVQEYVESIERDGEMDMVFIDGGFSHAVHKEPALRLGEGIVDRPWVRMAWSGVTTPNSEQLSVAQESIRIVSEILGEVPTYGRVDLVGGPSGVPLVLEIELIDPYLSLDMVPEAASRLAESVLRTGSAG